MRIAEVAPLWTSVPPATYGGTERMVHLLTEELVRRGHEVTLFASGDSTTSARLRAVCPEQLFRRANVYKPALYKSAAIADALATRGAFDVIHCHLGCFSIPFGSLSPAPVVHTLFSTLSVDDVWTLRRFPQATVTARTCRQIAPVPDGRRRRICVVPNGCDFGAYQFAPGPGKYLAFLGRMAWEKSPGDAIAVARKAGMPIMLAGQPVYAEEHEYFNTKVKPLIDGRNVVHMGPVTDAEKNSLFRDASALLFPIRWEEPFGIVMVEAMACGVPVLACDRGSVREVVDFGKTGYYCASAEEMARFLPLTLALDRQAVREQARKRFSHTAITDQYLRIYEAPG